MNKNIVIERVKRGAQLLDEMIPGWADEINLNRLDLNSTCNCVLGQIYGSYGIGMFALNIRDEINYGFNANTTEDMYEVELIWLQEINKRMGL